MKNDAQLVWRLIWIPAAIAALMVAPKIVVILAMFTAGWLVRGSKRGREIAERLSGAFARRTTVGSQS